jgi:hypothetical protein
MVSIRPSIISTTFPSFQRLFLVVGVVNGTKKPFVFSTEDIHVYVNGKPAKVFTYGELVTEARKQQALGALFIASNGVAQSVNAANSGTYHSGTYNYGGNTGAYSGYSYNPAAAIQAQATANTQTLMYMNTIDARANKVLDTLSSTALKKTTVLPQQTYGGNITIEKMKAPKITGNILVKISAGDEIHEFNFQLSKVGPHIGFDIQ